MVIKKMVQIDEMITTYDEEAEATGWYGPEVSFGLTYAYVQPGQSMLDIGIGTGLGSILFLKAGLEIHGMDSSPQMLDVCRTKGFSSLHLHDLRKTPYPFDSESVDHAVCTGVFNFFSDLSPFFQETNRILRKGGLFIFVVGDRSETEAHEFEVGVGHTKSEKTVTMYLHSTKQIAKLMARYGFEPLRDLSFTVFMDRERTKSMPVRSYLVRKRTGIEQACEGDGEGHAASDTQRYVFLNKILF